MVLANIWSSLGKDFFFQYLFLKDIHAHMYTETICIAPLRLLVCKDPFEAGSVNFIC